MQEPFIGNIQYFAFDYAPKGWALCNGAILPVQQNQALFALLGTYYGGNGTTNFGLPDLQGRTIIGQGQSSGTAVYSMGNKGGTETVTLPASSLPVHTHTATNAKIGASNTISQGITDPTNAYPAVPGIIGSGMYASAPAANNFLGTPSSTGVSVTITAAGGSTPMNTLSPYIALTCCISTTGYFPSRN